MAKYRNRSFDNEHGHWDSSLEYYRYLVLLEAEKKGIISNIRRQVDYILIPEQYELRLVMRKTKKGMIQENKTCQVEKSCAYRADFVYTKYGYDVIEDTKGYRTRDYIIKRKLMRFQGHPIREVKSPNEPV